MKRTPYSFIKRDAPGATNYLLNGNSKEWYVSFNPAPCRDIAIFRADKPGGETMLMFMRDGTSVWCGLNGDFREQFTKAANTGSLKACFALYMELRPDHDSTWSTYRDSNDTDLAYVMRWLDARIGDRSK